MSAELVDPFAPQPREQISPSDMHEDITARLRESHYNDPPLHAEMLQRLLMELKSVANDPYVDALTLWARRTLEQMHHRAVTGIPWGEPQEPADSLDSERRLPR